MYSVSDFKKFINKPIYCHSDICGYQEGNFYILREIDNDIIENDIDNIKYNLDISFDFLRNYELDDSTELFNIYINPPLDSIDMKNATLWYLNNNKTLFVIDNKNNQDDDFSKHFELITNNELRKRKIKNILNK